MIYLSGATNAGVRAMADDWPIGLMVQPGNRVHSHIRLFPHYAADNGCFAESKGKPFDPAWWLTWLDRLPREKCLFATAPDVLGDAEATWARSEPWLVTIRAMGFPAALVAQDGFDPDVIDWDAIDALFTGGTDAFKLSEAAHHACRLANAKGKWTHMGRVNSWRRIELAAQVGYRSTDGTFVAFGPDIRVPELVSWLRRLETQPFLPL